MNYCSGCATPIFESVCACGMNKPAEGWPEDNLLDTWVDNRYRIVRRLGQGGTSLVYLAQRFHPEGMAALKVTLPHLKGRAWRARLEREAMVLSQLRSPFAVRCYGQGQLRDGSHYLAMEYLKGQPLAETLRDQGPFKPSRAILFTLQAAHAIAEAHSKGIIHRDIKPANMFHLTDGPQERIKVVDFGIAVHQGVTDLPGLLLGTPRYMAPEQVSSPETVDGRADIFALGMVLYELLTGSMPYPPEPTLKLLGRRLTGAPEPLESRLPSPALPPDLYRIVGGMVAPRLEDRFQTMDDVITALMAVHRELSCGTSRGEGWMARNAPGDSTRQQAMAA